MLTKPQPPRIHLPKGWQGYIQESRCYRCFLAQPEKDICHSSVE